MLIDIGHPADVHLFKNMAWNLLKRGHGVKFTAKDKDVTVDLLRAYGFEYVVLGQTGKGLANQFRYGIRSELKLLRFALKFKPDIFVSMVSPYAAQASKILRKPLIAFEDTEHASLVHRIGLPFVDAVCTSTCFRKDFGRKQVRYNGYHELAYLHPNYFTPDPSVLEEIGISRGERFIVVRLVSWDALHDRGHHGFTDEIELARRLESYGRVLLSSERRLGEDLEKYRIDAPPHRIHDLLHYAAMYIGEGATMASEAALLGTPSIYVSTFLEAVGYCQELEREYGLLYSFQDQDEALERAAELLGRADLKEQWAEKRERVLRDKIDVTEFMTDFVENYPQSFLEYKRKEVV